MQSSFPCMCRLADCLNDSVYTQQPRISLEGSAVTAASHLSLLLLRIHQFPLPQEQGISKVHQAGIYFSSVCHWQKPRCPCPSGQCPSLCRTDTLTLAAAQALCFHSSYFYSQAVAGMLNCMHAVSIHAAQTQDSHYWCLLACTWTNTKTHTVMCVPSHVCLHSPEDSSAA